MAPGSMQTEALAQLERIEALLAALPALSWLEAGEIERIRADLLDFDADHWPLVRVLSLPLYQELTALLESGAAARLLPERPRLAVVMPLHQGRRELLQPALASLRAQVAVAIDCLISIDGDHRDLSLVQAVLADLGADQDAAHWRVALLMAERNQGVGMCRNRALQQVSAPCFTCLDADDVFHPLRCLHALLVLLREGLMRLNTGWCRASLLEKKIVLINDRIAHVGHTSFIARTEILQQYGYQAPLRFYEDTEFMQRHRFFGVAMLDSPVVAHYQHTEPRSDYVSLGTAGRVEVHAIANHPYLCGSVIAELPQSWLEIKLYFEQLYPRLATTDLPAAFPAFPALPRP